MNWIIIGLTLGLIIYYCFNNVSQALISFIIVVSTGIFMTVGDRSSRDSKIHGGSRDSGSRYSGSLVKDYNTFLKRDIKSHKSINVDYDPELKKILTTQIMPKLSHIKESAEKSSNLNRILDLSVTQPYTVRKPFLRRTLHWGQLKLFLSEVEFLTKVQQDAGKRDIILVYAGAAPGDHDAYLHSLFPSIRFELYDPNDFIVKDSDKIKTHVQFFTDADAKYWQKYVAEHPDIYLAFVTDIRTNPPTPENIKRNMDMQMKWWQIMNPDLSMFKFRLPWEPGKTTYPEGDIYLQCYPSAVSTETRLIVKKSAKLIEYDNKQYEDACFAHNTIARTKYYDTYGDFNLDHDGIDNCYDCISFVRIIDEYTKINKGKKLFNLIKEVQRSITHNRLNIKAHTEIYFKKALDGYLREMYVACGNDKCQVCVSGLKKKEQMKSKATLENELEYLKKV